MLMPRLSPPPWVLIPWVQDKAVQVITMCNREELLQQDYLRVALKQLHMSDSPGIQTFQMILVL